MDAYAKPFIAECMFFFKSVLKIDLEEGSCFSLTDDNIPAKDITALVGLAGKARGAVAISMNKTLALKVVEKMTGTLFDDLNCDVSDALGELVNIIAGRGKKYFENTLPMVISVPTIIYGEKYLFSWQVPKPAIVCIPFKLFESEVLTLSVTISSI
ncbi:MAG: chemotaxis protein CheX [Spirochaetaceae bacterium]|jgi:chemotaxis protein CheX|nr:chemotaxis protein CheX [Spirochaetaceae bacterium]